MQENRNSDIVNDMRKHIILKMASEGPGAGKLRAILDGVESGRINPDNIVIADPDVEMRTME